MCGTWCKSCKSLICESLCSMSGYPVYTWLYTSQDSLRTGSSMPECCMLYRMCLPFSTNALFFFKQKTAYEVRISAWISDVCSSDLNIGGKPMLSFCEVPVKRCDKLGIDEDAVA